MLPGAVQYCRVSGLAVYVTLNHYCIPYTLLYSDTCATLLCTVTDAQYNVLYIRTRTDPHGSARIRTALGVRDLVRDGQHGSARMVLVTSYSTVVLTKTFLLTYLRLTRVATLPPTPWRGSTSTQLGTSDAPSMPASPLRRSWHGCNVPFHFQRFALAAPAAVALAKAMAAAVVAGAVAAEVGERHPRR